MTVVQALLLEGTGPIFFGAAERTQPQRGLTLTGWQQKNRHHFLPMAHTKPFDS